MTACLKDCMPLWSMEASGCILCSPLRRGTSALASCTSGCPALLDIGDADACRVSHMSIEHTLHGEHISGRRFAAAQPAAWNAICKICALAVLSCAHPLRSSSEQYFTGHTEA